MTLPVTVPNTFANATTSIPLANLDANFTTIYAAVNGIGNGSETLANVQVSGGTLSNVTLDNVTVDVETLSNVTLVDVTVTSGNATFTTANATTIDTTDIEVTNIKAKDGTASVSIADSTGIPTISKATVIETTDNTNAALRITQLGTGNALLVEDAANPDATPFVVNANGQVGIGTTAPSTGFNYDAPSGDAYALIRGDTAARLHIRRSGDNPNAPALELYKSRGTFASPTIVSSGDQAGTVSFFGHDGTQNLPVATIIATVDGTPGTNDMPGRLVFSTTADGASTPTERMRIDSAGNVGVGGTGAASTKVTVTGTLPSSSSTSRGFSNLGVAPTSSTAAYQSFFSNPSTADGITGLTALSHFSAVQGTITGGTRVAPTNQYGFISASSLTGATNNYGFYSDIASGTGRWNFYANGTADNYFAGQVQLGAGTVSAPALSTTGDTNTGIYFPAADNIGFATGGTIRGRWTTDGLCFGSDTAAANALDDYEEGTWTPTAASGGPGSITAYTSSGRYIKIGNNVYCWGAINISNVGTASGSFVWGGAPFTSFDNGFTTDPRASIFLVREDNSTGTVYQGFLSENSTSGAFLTTANNAVTWASNTTWVFCFTYIAT